MIENADEMPLTWEDVTRISAAELEGIEQRRDAHAAREACKAGQCWCHEIAAPYALFAFLLPIFAVAGLIAMWVIR